MGTFPGVSKPFSPFLPSLLPRFLSALCPPTFSRCRARALNPSHCCLATFPFTSQPLFTSPFFSLSSLALSFSLSSLMNGVAGLWAAHPQRGVVGHRWLSPTAVCLFFQLACLSCWYPRVQISSPSKWMLGKKLDRNTNTLWESFKNPLYPATEELHWCALGWAWTSPPNPLGGSLLSRLNRLPRSFLSPPASTTLLTLSSFASQAQLETGQHVISLQIF